MSSTGVLHRRSRGLWIAALVVAQLLGFASGAVAQDAATITGRVTNAEGTGIPGVIVRAVDTVTYMQHDYGSTTTDTSGGYTLVLDPGLVGNVVVMFDAAASNLANDTDYIGEFHDDSALPLGAKYLPPGSTGVDAQLTAGGSVSGTVYAPGGASAIPGVQVTAYTGIFAPTATTDAGGAYVLRGLAAGSATVAVVTTAYNEAKDKDYTPATTSATITTGSRTTGVDLALGQGGRIEGLVASGGSPLEGIAVGAYGAPNVYSAYTAWDGTYVLRGVAPGASYQVSFSPSQYNIANDAGYLGQTYTVDNVVQLVTVVAAQSTTGIDADLVEGGTVSGTVFGPDGTTGLEGIYVTEAMSSARDMTDENGQYTLKGLSGWVRVRFDPATYNAANGTAYLVQYYGGAADLMSAAWIPVTIGEDTPGIDATMRMALPTTGSITGTVYGPDGTTPLEGIRVLAGGAGGPSTYTLTNGTYELTNLAPGFYSVWFDPTAYNETNDPDLLSEYYPTPFRVTAGAVSSGVDATLEGVPGDSTPPSTGIVVSSEPGNGGWYLTKPLVTLTMSEAGTIYYGWGDGVVLSASSSATFAAPQGENTLTYWSVDVAGNIESPAGTMEFKVDTVAPAAPTDLSAVATGETTIDLSWAPVTDDASGIGGYIILMDGDFLAEVSDEAYQATGLTRDTYHEFIVFAVDAAGNVGMQSAAAGATTFRNPGSAHRRYPEHPEHP